MIESMELGGAGARCMGRGPVAAACSSFLPGRLSVTDRYVVAAFFGALYYFFGQLGMHMAQYALPMGLVWPATGVAVAATWLLGSVAVPFLLLAELATALPLYSMPGAVTLACGNVLGVWLGVVWYRRLRLDAPYFIEPRNTVLFMVCTACLPAVISASVGVVVMQLSGAISPAEAGHAWCIWMLGSMTGSMTVSSCILVWVAEGWRSIGRLTLERLGIWALLLCAAYFIFGSSEAGMTSDRPLGFVMAPLLAWAAYTMSHRELVSVVLLGSGYAVWATLQGAGPFVGLGYPDSLLLLQVFILVLTSTAYIVHATASSHRLAVRSLQITQDAAIFSLASLAETRDPETGSHILRTREYVRLLALQLSGHFRFREYLTPRRIEQLYKSAPLHDIGKVGVPDAILCKPGRVTSEEFEEIKKHTLYGRDVLANATGLLGMNSFLTVAEEVIFTHHERWDGRGYPQGLQGEEIPVSGRLMALADVYDALTSKRCYKAAMPHEEAKGIILEGRGTHFDPAVVDAFLRCERDFLQVGERYRDGGADEAAPVAARRER